ncbi:hypothetical protein SO802_014531 [Lithocarpus litseifolius]|uniref:Aminopeptidase n=1 Tax=Lithocarpus litseifolius TaxID=425828 RepID=A0AAW2CR72_9ROSI
MGAIGVGAVAAVGSMLRNTNNGGFHNTLIHRNQPTTPPVTHQPTAPQVPVQHTLMSEVEENANKDSSSSDEDAYKASYDEIKKLAKDIIKEALVEVKDIVKEALVEVKDIVKEALVEVKDANKDSSEKEEDETKKLAKDIVKEALVEVKDAYKASSEKEEDETKKLAKDIVKEALVEVKDIVKEALVEVAKTVAEYIENSWTGPPQKSIEQFKGQARLPKFAVPIFYNIRLKPDLKACKFAGSVAIELNIVADTSFIVLNAAELSVDTASVSFTRSSNSKVLKPLKVHVVEEDEILVLDFANTLPIGIGSLTIHFHGTLNDKMKGFYTSTYEHNSEKKNMAVTQFEPDGARRCFPCWDEPACKAMFKITLDVPSKLVALSNMPIIEEKIDGDLKTVSYQESPIMSTYLVAIVVGLFDYVEHLTSDGVKVRVYCQVGKLNQGRFALDVAVRTLELYREYFAVPYFLPKLDMVAIPDFAFGAMANYGLVTCCETDLLYDNQYSTAANKQRVVIVVAHELAHQWFGNLVTIEWWTHLWLNEGFATWVSYLAANHLFPEWKVWTQFLDDYTEGLRLDGLAESHPIELEINHAREIDEIGNAISYNKGASVIRMLQSYLGAECFQSSRKIAIGIFYLRVLKRKLGWEPKTGESHLDAMLRGEVLTALAVFGHDLTLKEANRRFHAFLDDRNTPLLHPNIRKAAYVAIMREVSTSNRFGYESLLRVYRETDSSQEKTRVLSSLTSSPDPNIIVEALNFLLSSEVRTLDAVLGLGVSREGRQTAWTWMKDNWEHISKTWGSGNLITHFVNSIVSPVCHSLSPSLFYCYLLVPQVLVFVLCVSIKNLENLNSNAFYQLLLLVIFFFFFFLFSFSCYVLSIPQFASFEKAKEIEEFFASRTNSKIARTLKQSIERVHINANWVQRVHNEEHLGETMIKFILRDGETKCVIL